MSKKEVLKGYRVQVNLSLQWIGPFAERAGDHLNRKCQDDHTTIRLVKKRSFGVSSGVVKHITCVILTTPAKRKAWGEAFMKRSSDCTSQGTIGSFQVIVPTQRNDLRRIAKINV